jgi:excisionase family DNA binding protein
MRQAEFKPVNPREPDNLNIQKANSEVCSLCRDLLVNLSRFFDMLDAARQHNMSDLLTVDEVAKELKISKSEVYCLIHHGHLEAINIVDSNGRVPQRDHYRIERPILNNYLESKKVRPSTDPPVQPPRLRRLPRVKNHLGL